MTTATANFSEDDIYRASTQYRLWSFSLSGLAAQRQLTHERAIERARQHARLSNVTLGANGEHGGYVSEDEELRLVQRYCEQIRVTSDHFKWPVGVKATAVQFLKRFYISNSCITYPPKDVYKTVLFLACKTEATHMTLSEYARRISTEKEAILAPEYKVMQALRFTLDVRQPYRGLKGALMEMLDMAAGMDGGEGSRERMMNLEAPPQHCKTPWIRPPSAGVMTAGDLRGRIEAAYAAARAIVDAPALLTDAFFLYTPAQIIHAALFIADAPLTEAYLSIKLALASSVHPKILATIKSCADMLSSFSEQNVMSKDERAELERRLENCRDPATKDLVKRHAAAKMGDSDAEEKKAKRRQMEREKSIREGEDLFGPSLADVSKRKD